MVVWIIAIAFICIGTTGFVILSLFRKVQERKVLLMENIQVTQEELETKAKIFADIAVNTLGMTKPEVIEEYKAAIEKLREKLRSEKGRGTIIQAESEAVDLRLRELEEIEKELENSSIEASREVEMLRVRAKEAEGNNQKLKEHLENTAIELDKIMSEITHPEAGEEFAKIKAQMDETNKQIAFFEERVSEINRSYLDLKRAYDALDIEYAQLYEKQAQG